jgi:HEAT repeat protein
MAVAHGFSDGLSSGRSKRWLYLVGGLLVVVGVAAIVWMNRRASLSGETAAARAASLGRMVDEGRWGADALAADAAADPDPRVREAAMAALGRLGHRPDLMRAGMRDPDPSVRYAAAVGLGGVKDDAVADALAKFIEVSDDTPTRLGAVMGLARMKTPRSTVHLVRAMDLRNADVRTAAMNAVCAHAKMRWETPPDPRDHREWVRRVEVIRSFGFVQDAFKEDGG